MRKTSTEMGVKVSNGRITSVELLVDGSCKFTVEVSTEGASANANTNDVFVLCEASKLSLEDEFMKHTPCSENERILKRLLEEAIKSELKDFYCPMYDPSFDKDGNICYVEDAKPAVGKSYNWWKENAERFCPERGSRLGRKKEYIAFLGILIKKLSESRWSIAEAWNAVCNDSRELGLGNYRHRPYEKTRFKSTGSRIIGVFYDLTITHKLLSEDKEAGGYWDAGGYYDPDFEFFEFSPLAELSHEYDRNKDQNLSVGWTVLEKSGTDH